MLKKLNLLIMIKGLHWMEKVCGVFGNGFARSVVILGVNNTLSSHTDNKKNFLVLSEGLSEGINDTVGAAEK